MLEDLFGWLSNVDFNIRIQVLPVPMDEKSFDWTPFLSAFLGGILSVTASIVAFRLADKAQKKSKEEEEKKSAAARAVSGYFKLLQLSNLLGNIKLHIDESFRIGHEAGITGIEPYMLVGPAAGRFLEPERIKAEEFGFILEVGNSDLINDIGLIEQRAINTHELLEKYSTMRVSFAEWMERIPGLKREMNGGLAVDVIPIEFKSLHDTRAGQLNILLWGVMEHLDLDIEKSMNTIQKFSDVAHEKYKPYFPKIEIAMELTRR